MNKFIPFQYSDGLVGGFVHWVNGLFDDVILRILLAGNFNFKYYSLSDTVNKTNLCSL